MRLTIRGSKLLITPRLGAYIKRRARITFARFGARVSRVQVQLAEGTGPRGGGGQSCTVVVTVRGAAPLVAEHHDPRMTLAVDHAMARVSRHVARTLELLDGRLTASNRLRDPSGRRRHSMDDLRS